MGHRMPGEPTHWIAVAGEDAGHFHTVTHLVDRVLEASIDWFTRETRDELRAWRGPNEGEQWWGLKRAFGDARAARLPIHGHFGGSPGHPEAGMIRAQLLLWKRACIDGRPISAGILVRDTDREGRRTGALQAIGDHAAWGFRVLLAYPDPEIEAWTIIGFEPASNVETTRLAEITARLGFSPVACPERLTSTVTGSERDVKLVLEELTGGDRQRRATCLDQPLSSLKRRGTSCGLTAFLDAIEAEVVPLYGMTP